MFLDILQYDIWGYILSILIASLLFFITIITIYYDYNNNHKYCENKTIYQNVVDDIGNVEIYKENTELFNISTLLYQNIFPEDVELTNQLYLIVIIMSFFKNKIFNEESRNKLIKIVNKYSYTYLSADNIIKCLNNNNNFIDTSNKSLYLLANDIVNDSSIIHSLNDVENIKNEIMTTFDTDNNEFINGKLNEYYTDCIKHIMTGHGLNIYIKYFKFCKKNNFNELARDIRNQYGFYY